MSSCHNFFFFFFFFSFSFSFFFFFFFFFFFSFFPFFFLFPLSFSFPLSFLFFLLYLSSSTFSIFSLFPLFPPFSFSTFPSFLFSKGFSPQTARTGAKKRCVEQCSERSHPLLVDLNITEITVAVVDLHAFAGLSSIADGLIGGSYRIYFA